MIKEKDSHLVNQLTPDRTSLRISLIYLGFSIIWILLGDRLLLLFVQDPGTMTTLQTYKGLLFVFGSMVLIFLLVKHALTHADNLQQLLREEKGKYRLLVENQNDLVVKVDSEGCFLDVSPIFVYTISRDLKSPLVTVESFLGMLRSDLKSADQERINMDIEYIQTATDKMKGLLGALLQLSRIGRMDNPPEIVKVDTLISECLKTLAGSIHQRGIDVTSAPTKLTLYGDRLRLGQLWQNLVENAVKYMGKQPQPRISLGMKQHDCETIFYVRDNGIGIAPDDTKRIFGIFTRLDPTVPGNGLGLALVKKIVELYQGRIWVESEGIGHGSCFYFTLPITISDSGELKAG